ncbi:MAG: bifunctional glutamate N-acetyltransferase/amino-acid acetyltransferase ArgJ [Lachnospiraceae bacterium]|jgi:glutamate N-acetyltransferase/amino-acid N-acetyltransferase|nr:bifunctional glutamate N-acetyltransferase/amino-acid acetyltransferase ArgJ [Lachnospiraceae bacterium]
MQDTDKTAKDTGFSNGTAVRTEGGVTAAKGFSAASAAAHIKYAGRDDMAMIYSEAPCTAAGTYTSNVVKAAPVLWDRAITASGKPVRAVVVNAGIANACTGEEGMRICRAEAEAAAGLLGILPGEVLLGSTGVIGMQMPEDRLQQGIGQLAGALAHTQEAGTAAARAIMTTDTVKKELAVTFRTSDGALVTLGGMSKGSGMIMPNMCTMLCYVTTDAAIEAPLLDKAMHAVVADTFNMISVDGDTSTNDTFLCLANGLSGNAVISGENGDYFAFENALRELCTELARTMAGDGEGATKLIEAKVVGADTVEHAKTLAKSVICSNLTKAAIFGGDANWGRILCALGYAGVPFDPDKTDLRFMDPKDPEYAGLLLFTKGAPADYSEQTAASLLSGKEVDIVCDMHMGEAEAVAWGCDLTYDYVKINADYRS